MHGTSEPDVEVDPNVARTRETGGVEHTDAEGTEGTEGTEGDASTTTGTDVNEEFVGRVEGQDVGYAGTTGAEARAERDGVGEEDR
jgi:hypothetical protein